MIGSQIKIQDPGFKDLSSEVQIQGLVQILMICEFTDSMAVFWSSNCSNFSCLQYSNPLSPSLSLDFEKAPTLFVLTGLNLYYSWFASLHFNSPRKLLLL